MTKKYFLSLLALMFCFNAFSQQSHQLQGQGTEANPYLIQSVADFNYFKQSGDKSQYYKQTVDIDLGDRGSTEDAIISTTFSGTYDGGGYTITYSASFQGTTYDGDYGLFSTVSGTIKNLNVNANVTFSGTKDYMQVGLLCGYLTSSGTIQSCNVSGNINSTVQAYSGGGTDAGLVVGECSGGTIKYCNATGNVTGVGYVGGVVGQMSGSSDVLGCSFVGSVTALSPKDTSLATEGSFAGGICGMASDNSSVDLCYVKADITGVKDAQGTTCSATIGYIIWGQDVNGGTADVTNCYVEGTINGLPIDSYGEIADNDGTIENNYYEGATVQNCTKTNAECIADTLNNAAKNAGESENIHFSPVGSSNVIFGVVIDENNSKTCGVPTNLVVSNNAGTCIATWGNAIAGENIIVANTWKYMLSGGDLSQVYHGTTTNTTLSSPLPASQNPYTFTVYTDCSATVNGLTSDAVSQTFTVACPTPTNLKASDITDNGFTISWTSSADCQVILNSGEPEVISSTNNTKTYENLLPETTYTIIVKAKCGTGYVEQASITVTTAPLSAPTNLEVETSWQEIAGTATITWNSVTGATAYEVNTAGNTQTSPYQITGLTTGSHTAKVRTVKTIAGTNYYSNWVEMPYAISAIPAPSNPEVEYTQDGDYYDVTISWTAGTTPNDGWVIGGTEETNPYVLQNQKPGNSTSVAIQEIVGESTSSALVVPIQVPCLPASKPSVDTTQTTAIFTFASAIENRQVIIGSNVYDVPNTTLEITGLESGATYSYEIREYCNVATNTYSSIDSTFSTLACYSVAGLSVSNVELTTATVSWTSQSSIDGLEYKIVVNGGEPTIQIDTTINLTSINLTSLTQSTEYTVEVYEQCGAVGNWGAVSSITFTTKGTKNYISATSGDFTTGTTWIGGKAPNSADVDGTTITISQGHTLTLSSAFIIDGKYTVTNNGVLQITQKGELINTTDNNVGGIIEIETPRKTINQWTFIGAPFGDNYPYPLGVIKPVSGSDISVSQFVYEGTGAGDWSDKWATIDTTMEAGEGMFAWPFYTGVVTFTTYGDVCTWDETANNGAGDWKIGSYDFNQEPATELNNDNEITVTKSLTTSSGGNWMALANPYPFKLKVATFLADNSLFTNNPNSNSNNIIQGEVIYKFNGSNWTTHNSGDINVTEGFFVNFTNGGADTAIFKKTQRLENQEKSSSAQREFVKLALVDGKKEIDLLFAHNEKSENSYDIYDANKMFSPIEIAEPYFVTGGFDLVKEEVKELPYYATMNVRSYKDTVMSFVMKSIPDGLSVSIIDGENVINMYEGSVYTTEFLKGENEDRFKLYVRKADRLEEVSDRSVSITNCNRLVNVQSKEKDLTMDVFNAVGQIVYSTTEYNFNLASLPAGTYIVMAHNKRVNERVKIVIN